MVHNQGIAFCSNELLIGSSNDSSIRSTTGQRIQMKLQFQSSVCRSNGTRSEVRALRLPYSELYQWKISQLGPDQIQAGEQRPRDDRIHKECEIDHWQNQLRRHKLLHMFWKIIWTVQLRKTLKRWNSLEIGTGWYLHIHTRLLHFPQNHSKRDLFLGLWLCRQ